MDKHNNINKSSVKNKFPRSYIVRNPQYKRIILYKILWYKKKLALLRFRTSLHALFSSSHDTSFAYLWHQNKFTCTVFNLKRYVFCLFMAPEQVYMHYFSISNDTSFAYLWHQNQKVKSQPELN